MRQEVGFALFMAQRGDKALHAVPLVGFGSSKVLEIVPNDDGETYRSVYTIKMKDAVYVLHSFQKKSTKEKKTPKRHIDMIKQRLKEAIRHHADHAEQQEKKGEENDRTSR